MEEAKLTAVLEKKLADLQELERLTARQSMLIREKEADELFRIDNAKKVLLSAVLAADAGLLKEGALIGSSENAGIIAKKINLVINNLIKLEKENENMITKASMSLSGSHIEAYKMYKLNK
ncbi:MAG: hypothetical protein LLG37_05050 [Spirochaetia bacterium]|nr:hypothetical protein [Spirochaetia bacterium]